MRALKVYRNKVFAGVLTEEPSTGFMFRYDDAYYYDEDRPSVALTLPKTTQEYRSQYLFPFFFNFIMRKKLFFLNTSYAFRISTSTTKVNTKSKSMLNKKIIHIQIECNALLILL